MLGTHFSYSEAFAKGCSVKKAPPATLLKKRLWHRCFPMNFAKFLRTSFFTEHFWWLLLNNAGGLSANDMFDNNIRVLKVNSFMTEAVIL